MVGGSSNELLDNAPWKCTAHIKRSRKHHYFGTGKGSHDDSVKGNIRHPESIRQTTGTFSSSSYRNSTKDSSPKNLILIHINHRVFPFLCYKIHLVCLNIYNYFLIRM